MKKIQPPVVNDNDVIALLANSRRLRKTSYPHLFNSLQLMESLNFYYDSCQGDALRIGHTAISNELAKGLRAHYRSEIAGLEFIEQIRASSKQVCPMCGAPNPGTVDHLLPKEIYPEYSIFSKNLVPACSCNSKRGTITTSNNPIARVLHPYYDEVLNERLISCDILPLPEFPKATIKAQCIYNQHSHSESIRFHISSVVLRSGLERWLESKWSSLSDDPAGTIHTIPNKPVDGDQEFLSYLLDALERHDRSHGTPNNWNSIFCHGLINSEGVLSWLRTQHNQRHYNDEAGHILGP